MEISKTRTGNPASKIKQIKIAAYLSVLKVEVVIKRNFFKTQALVTIKKRLSIYWLIFMFINITS